MEKRKTAHPRRRGPAGGIGSALVRFASEAGRRVIATARPGDHARCLEQGAGPVFDFGDPNLAGRVLDMAPGGVDIHSDTSGRMPINAMEPMTASGGKVIVTAGADPQPPKTSLLPIFTRDISVIGFVVSLTTATELAEAAQAINTQLASGGFTTKSVDIMPLKRTRSSNPSSQPGSSSRPADNREGDQDPGPVAAGELLHGTARHRGRSRWCRGPFSSCPDGAPAERLAFIPHDVFGYAGVFSMTCPAASRITASAGTGRWLLVRS
jgi:hypothetical protein